MNSEIEKYVKKERQLSEQIEKLFAEKKLLEDKICVLNECLSLEKVQEKIVRLENKQKILRTLESIVHNLKVEIKPLDYLKQLLQRELMISTLPNDDLIEEQTNMESSPLTANSDCAIETSDSLSNVSSEDSVMVLSENDVVSDEEDFNTTEKTVENKVMYGEALQMASSVHLTVETPIKNMESILTSSNQMENINFIQSTTKDMVAKLMNFSSKSEPLLEMCSVIDKQDLQNYKEKEEIKLECNNEYITKTIQKTDQLYIFGKEPIVIKERDSLSKSINELWVKINTNESFKSSIENYVKIQANLIPKVQTAVEYNARYDQLYNQQPKSKDTCEIKYIDNVTNYVDHNSEIETNNLVSLTNTLKDEIISNSPLLNTENSSLLKECNKKKGNNNVEIDGQNNQCSYQFESRVSSDIKFKHFCNKLEYYTNINSNNFTWSTNRVKDTIGSDKYDLSANINNDKITTQSCGVVEFDTKGLNIELWNGIHHVGFQNLMTLQLECLSHFINGYNVFLHSYPCVGKSTICFISVLQRIDTGLNVCQAIILVPTLELSLSALKMIKSLGKFLNVSICIGNKYIPKELLVDHVVICTPDNLCDMIRSNSPCKDFIKMLVIDDADEMLNRKAFFNQMRQILLYFNNDPQLIILSSSKFEEILDFFSDKMSNPEFIIMSDERPSLNSILQYYVCLPEEWKFDAICELYDVLNLMRTVVYCNTWIKSENLAEKMRLKTYTVSAVNNEMVTSQRQKILRQFRSDNIRVLVTNGLLRGEDFTEVVLVINYDFPKNPKDYARRIVSCFDRRVKVINFISPNDTIAKKNIETVFNVQMLNLPQDVTNLRVSNLNSSNNPKFSLLEL